MKSSERDQYLTRDGIMKMLSDDEVAKVSTAETEPRLAEGDEYLDLEHLADGVRRSVGVTTTPMGHVLPRKAVHAKTWTRILRRLPAASSAGATR